MHPDEREIGKKISMTMRKKESSFLIHSSMCCGRKTRSFFVPIELTRKVVNSQIFSQAKSV